MISTVYDSLMASPKTAALIKTQAKDTSETDAQTTEAEVQNKPIEPDTKTPETDFDTLMKRILGETKTEVNEEELFSGLIEARLERSNPEAARFYRDQVTALSQSMARADGYVPVEDVAKAALRATVAAGMVDDATAQTVHAQAFKAAQLDTNLDALYDGRGSGDDPTIAVSAMEAALLSMRAMVDKFDSGEVDAGSRPLDVASNAAPSAGAGATDAGSAATGDLSSAPSGSQQLDGSGGFLWKPESEKNGKLVVLLPKELAGLVNKVEIHSSLPPSAATMLDEGKFSSNANGGRDHFRFSEPGDGYGDVAYVVAYREDGEMLTWKIDDPSERND